MDLTALRRIEPEVSRHAAEWRATLTVAIRRRNEQEIRQAFADGKHRIRAMRDPAAWFFRHVDVQDDGCWTWTGAVTEYGLPLICWRGQQYMVRRWVSEMLDGPIPRGVRLRTICDNRACVCPIHLKRFCL